jgi:hypothetical protein
VTIQFALEAAHGSFLVPQSGGKGRANMNQVTASRVPLHLWIVGVLSLLWHMVGALDFVLTKLQNRDYIASMTESMGIDADTAIA